MNADAKGTETQKRAAKIVSLYPLVVLIVGTLLNLYAFGVNTFSPTLPSSETISALIFAAALLVFNHAWLMTSTELTRVYYKLYATPEEWMASGKNPEEASREGVRELKRRHDTHLNTTENSVCFVLLSLPFTFAAPPALAVYCWLVGYAVARLGYTWSFLSGRDNARGVFMTLSLCAMFGMTSYLLLSLVV